MKILQQAVNPTHMLVNLTKQSPPANLVIMTKIIKLYEAKTHLSDLVERASRGEEFIIAKGDEPKARLLPIRKRTGPRAPGGWEGRVWTSDDFDAPLPSSILDGFKAPG